MWIRELPKETLHNLGRSWETQVQKQAPKGSKSLRPQRSSTKAYGMLLAVHLVMGLKLPQGRQEGRRAGSKVGRVRTNLWEQTGTILSVSHSKPLLCGWPKSQTKRDPVKLEKLRAQLLPHHMKDPINRLVTSLSCTRGPALTLQMLRPLPNSTAL